MRGIRSPQYSTADSTWKITRCKTALFLDAAGGKCTFDPSSTANEFTVLLTGIIPPRAVFKRIYIQGFTARWKLSRSNRRGELRHLWLYTLVQGARCACTGKERKWDVRIVDLAMQTRKAIRSCFLVRKICKVKSKKTKFCSLRTSTLKRGSLCGQFINVIARQNQDVQLKFPVTSIVKERPFEIK